jgi:hypothetical protein
MQYIQTSQVTLPSKSGDDASHRNTITNAVAAAVAIAGAIVASPSAMEKLPAAVGVILKTTATLGNTTQPLVVTVLGVLIAAVTHPPRWLSASIGGLRRRVHL